MLNFALSSGVGVGAACGAAVSLSGLGCVGLALGSLNALLALLNSPPRCSTSLPALEVLKDRSERVSAVRCIQRIQRMQCMQCIHSVQSLPSLARVTCPGELNAETAGAGGVPRLLGRADACVLAASVPWARVQP